MWRPWLSSRVGVRVVVALHVLAVLAALAPVAAVGLAVTGVTAVAVVDRSLSTGLDATVWARRWRRTVTVARWDEVERVVDCQDVPEGARVVARGSRVSAEGRLRHHHHRSSHGSSSHASVRCRYRILEWVPEEPRELVGDAWEARAWPEAPSAEACPEPVERGCVRGTGWGEETLLTIVPTGQAALSCAVPEDTWSRVAVGDEVRLPVSLVFRRPLCDAIELEP